jgi:hypothetical protein
MREDRQGWAGLSQMGISRCRAIWRTRALLSPASTIGLRTRRSVAACNPGR